MKKRMLMLFVSLFALTPALLGSAWGGQHTPEGPTKECELMQAKNFDPVKQVLQPVKHESNQATQTKVF